MAVLLTFIRIHTVTTMTALRTTMVMPTGIATNSKALLSEKLGMSLVSLPGPGELVGVGVGSGWEERRGTTKLFANRGIVHALVEANIDTEAHRDTPLTPQAPGTGCCYSMISSQHMYIIHTTLATPPRQTNHAATV